MQHDVPEQYHISKEFIAYVETLLWATPYWRGDDPRLLQNVFDVYQNQLKRYAKVEYKTFHKHIAIAMKQWLTEFPKTTPHKKVEQKESETEDEEAPQTDEMH